MSHDTDKLIRQLSLVAFLMAERRPLTARDVKQNVEGYQEMSDEVVWVRSYVLDEGGASVGMVCIYEATGPEAIRRHGARAGLPVDEIIRVVDTVVKRADPEPAMV